MAKKKTFENIISNLLGEPVCNLCHAFYDQYVEANVKFRSRAGMKEVIIRRQLGKCCKWCADLAGIYEYGDHPDDVFRRHDNCKCMVTYKDEDGYTDVWTKKKFESEKEARRAKEFDFLKNNIQKRSGERKNAIPVDEETYKKLTKDFLDRGGIIKRDEETARHLKQMNAGAAYLDDFDVILFYPEPTISETLEETYHAYQNHIGLFSEYEYEERRIRREIDAQKYLLSMSKKYKIPLEEIKTTKDNLRDYKRLLREILQK